MTQLYLIKNGDAYKIGVSKNPTTRLSSLRTAAPTCSLIFSCSGSVYFERFLHDIFDPKCCGREWFKLSVEDVNFVVSGEAGRKFRREYKMLNLISAKEERERVPTTRQRTLVISKRSVKTKQYWVVDWRPPSQKRKRLFFKTESEAKSAIESLRATGQCWTMLSDPDRHQLSLLWAKAKAAGVSLDTVWNAFASIAK